MAGRIRVLNPASTPTYFFTPVSLMSLTVVSRTVESQTMYLPGSRTMVSMSVSSWIMSVRFMASSPTSISSSWGLYGTPMPPPMSMNSRSMPRPLISLTSSMRTSIMSMNGSTTCPPEPMCAWMPLMLNPRSLALA